MSKYTTEVRYICEVSAGLTESEGYTSIDTILNKSVKKVFDFDFPIFDENYRTVLEKKILRHYYTREIGLETVGLWKHFLYMRMNEIMPYYNKLYATELYDFNPFYDVDLTTTHEKKGNENGTSDGTSENSRREQVDTNSASNYTTTINDKGTIEDVGENESTRTDNTTSTARDSGTQSESGSNVPKNTRWDIYSDTPQGTLDNVDNEKYLTSARKIIDDGTGSTNSSTTTFGKTVTTTNTGTVKNDGTDSNTRTLDTEREIENLAGSTGDSDLHETNNGKTSQKHNINTTEEYLHHVYGKAPGVSYAKLLKEYRETFMNIDMMIINDLSDLFFNLW